MLFAQWGGASVWKFGEKNVNLQNGLERFYTMQLDYIIIK